MSHVSWVSIEPAGARMDSIEMHKVTCCAGGEGRGYKQHHMLSDGVEHGMQDQFVMALLMNIIQRWTCNRSLVGHGRISWWYLTRSYPKKIVSS